MFQDSLGKFLKVFFLKQFAEEKKSIEKNLIIFKWTIWIQVSKELSWLKILTIWFEETGQAP